MSSKAINLGIVGLGYWGPNILRNFSAHPKAKVIACADLDEAQLSQIHHTHPEIYLTTKFPELLNQPVDAVVIATPAATHFKLAALALEKGKHVLVEKPLTTDYQDAIKLVQLAKKVNKILMVDHIFVYSEPVKKLKKLIDQKFLGDIYYFDSTRINLGLLQKDTNVIWDLACHDLAILDYLIPDKPMSISCIGGVHTQKDQVDLAYITLKYRTFFLAHINVNWLAPTKVRRIIIGGSKKMVVYDEGNVEERIKIYNKGITVSEDNRKKALINYRIGDMVSPFIPSEEALVPMCNHFIKSVIKNQSPVTDGIAGTKVVHLLELANKSLKSNKVLKVNL